MTGVAADLRTYLLAAAGVSTLIGTRMYPGVLEQDVPRPAVVYYKISGTHVRTLGGIVAAGTVRIQLDCHAATRLAADAVAAAIVARLRTLAALGPTTIGAGSQVCDVEIQGPQDGHAPPVDGSDEWEHIASLDVILNVG